MLDNVDGERARAEAGWLAFRTVESFLVWRLTGGKVHATDATNAACTMLYDIRDGRRGPDICPLLDFPVSLLPEVKDSAADFGTPDAGVRGAKVPIFGVAGDQQAVAVGEACFEPGILKSTCGTGCFALLNTGVEMVASKTRLLTIIACQLDGRPTRALEGSIFIAGAAVQWPRDGLRIVGRASETDAMARAALEAAGSQTHDLLEAMGADWPATPETTTKGAAWLAGNRAGLSPDREAFARTWTVERRFEPGMEAGPVEGWKNAIRRMLVS